MGFNEMVRASFHFRLRKHKLLSNAWLVWLFIVTVGFILRRFPSQFDKRLINEHAQNISNR